MKNKILTILGIVIFIICILTENSFAVITSATAILTTSKGSYELNDENEVITVTLKLNNLQSNNGVIAYSAVLEYDKSKVTYSGCSGSGKWSAPSFNEENGKLIATRSDNDFSSSRRRFVYN